MTNKKIQNFEFSAGIHTKKKPENDNAAVNESNARLAKLSESEKKNYRKNQCNLQEAG